MPLWGKSGEVAAEAPRIPRVAGQRGGSATQSVSHRKRAGRAGRVPLFVLDEERCMHEG